MKTWLFAVVEVSIAALALAAYFWSEQVALATAAALLAAILGIAQPLIAARKAGRLQAYQDRQFRNSVDALDGQLKELRDELIDPPLPHRPTVAAVLRRRFPQHAGKLLEQYDQIVQALETGNSDVQPPLDRFGDRVSPWSIGPYLEGLAALAAGNADAAHLAFCAATAAQPDWVAPWLGWAAALDRQGRWNELRQEHPHIRGVELLPYDAGDETTFLDLSESEREQLPQQFQQAAVSLGNYYTIAELQRSKEQIALSQDELKKAA